MYKIAIDGPGGAGKSSVAKEVARRLGIIYADTGALYRTVGLYMVNHGIDPKDRAVVCENLDRFSLELKFEGGKQIILLDGVDVKDTIRTPEMSMAASAVSAIPEVREYLLRTQRNLAKYNCVIMDGRDIGTVIFPNAEVKIFLTASPEARAKRRYEELIAKGTEVTYENVLNELIERDRNDSTRDIAPCKPADDAIMLDNSDYTPEQTVEKVIEIIKNKIPLIFDRPSPNSFYMRAHRVVAGFCRFLLHVRAHGLENIPESGAIMFCSNHISARDAVAIAAACRREIRFVAKKELFSVPVIGWLIKKLGAVKLNRGGSDVAALKASINLLKAGYAVSVFPQGHRYPGVNPATTPIKHGAGMICYHAGCDVVPVCVKTKKNRYPWFGKVDVIFGKPIKHEELGLVEGGTQEYRGATDIIFNEIIKLGGYDKLIESGEENN